MAPALAAPSAVAGVGVQTSHVNRDRLAALFLVACFALGLWVTVAVIAGRAVNPWVRVAVATFVAAAVLFVLAYDRGE